MLNANAECHAATGYYYHDVIVSFKQVLGSDEINKDLMILFTKAFTKAGGKLFLGIHSLLQIQ